MHIFLVGGAVRDRLLGLPVQERDWVVVGATPEEMLEQGFRAVGKDFPVFLHPRTGEEYALARTERKTGRGYHGFAVHAAPDVTLEADLLRRDLTINAMAEDENGGIVDPYGGQADLKARLLRHVSPAFAEDPVRILRLARFAARYARLGFTVAPETLELMRAMVAAGEADHLVPERIWKEMQRALTEANPEVFFQILHDCGTLARILPELDVLAGIPNPPQWHPEIDSFVHVMMVLRAATQLSEDPAVRFAALCHDFGKGLTPERYWPSHRGHDEAGVPLIEAACERLKTPKDYRELAVLVSRFHIRVHKAAELRCATILGILEQCDAFRRPERFEAMLIACEADARGRLGFEDEPYPQGQRFREALRAANAVDVKTLLARGIAGPAIKEAVHQERVRALRAVFGRE
ncbi:MAG: multifunctional CCA addition/repair protein [Gammaproteobacteria bacterium]|nr:multifunctional CCA addition/repair protein [Gammaproteobacteria bacterium]